MLKIEAEPITSAQTNKTFFEQDGFPQPSALTVEEENKIVEKAKNGDEEAVSVLFSIYFPRLFWYGQKRLNNFQDAQDFASQVFVKIIPSLPTYEIRERPFGAWVFRVAHNTLVSIRRSQNSDKRTDDGFWLKIPSQDQPSDPAEDVERQMLVNQVLAAAEKLPEFLRVVVFLRFVEGFSISEIAEKLGISKNNVKVRQHRAVLSLRGMLRQDGFSDIVDIKPESKTKIDEKIRSLRQEKLDLLPPYLRRVADLIRAGKTKEEAAQILGKRVDRIYSGLYLVISRLGLTKKN